MVAHEMTAHVVGQGKQSLGIGGQGKLKGGFPVKGLTVDQLVMGCGQQVIMHGSTLTKGGIDGGRSLDDHLGNSQFDPGKEMAFIPKQT